MRRVALGAAAVLVLGGCNAIFGVDGLTYDPSATTASSGGGGTATVGPGGGGAGGEGGAATGGNGGAAAGGGGGGLEVPVPLVRYRLDEASVGAVVGPVFDSGMPPALDLSPENAEGAMEYIEQDGNRGVYWNVAGGNAGLRAPVDAKLMAALDGATSLTIEAVFNVEVAIPTGSRIVHLSPPAQFAARLNLRVYANGSLEVNFNDAVGTFPVSLGQRTVVHVAIDSMVAPDDRVRFYVGGARVTPTVAVSLAAGATLAIPPTTVVNIGNRDCCRSPLGTIAFVALYAEPLDEAVIEARAFTLAVDDDGR